MINKLFGGKKSYFIELDENQNTETAVAETESAETEAADVAAPAAVTTEESTEIVVEAKPAAAKAAKGKTKATSKKKESATVTTATAQTPAWEEPFWVKVMNAKTSPEAKAAQEVAFATKYLMPTPSKLRRLPGPSMSMFKEMASQVKKPTA